MRHLLSTLAISLPAFAYASAHDAQVYMFDSKAVSPQPHSQEVSSDAARLILSRRLGPSQSSLLGQADEQLVKCLNEFGGRQVALLDSLGKIDDISRLLVVLEGIEPYNVPSIANPFWSKLIVPRAPDDLINDIFVENLLSYGSALSSSTLCSYSLGVADNLDQRLFMRLLDDQGCVARDRLFRPSKSNVLDREALVSFLSRGVTSWTGRPATAVLLIKSKTQSAMINNIIQTVFMDLSALALESKQETTIIVLARHRSKGFEKEAPPSLKPRYESDEQHLAHSSSSINSGYSKGASLLGTRRQTHVPSLLIPICHMSNTSCTEATQNCSGHGYCHLKHSGEDSSTTNKCYACLCRPQKSRNKDGKIKTIQWGGAACQKMDVSTPFFILAGLSVLLITAISWGINLLFSIGQEELPSVLSAGVAAPKLQT